MEVREDSASLQRGVLPEDRPPCAPRTPEGLEPQGLARLVTSLGFTGRAAQGPWSCPNCCTSGPRNILSDFSFFSTTATWVQHLPNPHLLCWECPSVSDPLPALPSSQEQCPPPRLRSQPGDQHSLCSTARPSAARVAAPSDLLSTCLSLTPGKSCLVITVTWPLFPGRHSPVQHSGYLHWLFKGPGRIWG